MINQLGGANIASYVCELTTHLLTGLMQLGVEIITPVEPEHRIGDCHVLLGLARPESGAYGIPSGAQSSGFCPLHLWRRRRPHLFSLLQ